MSAESRLVTIFTTGSPALLGIARSMLDDAQIEYLVKGEELQNLFGLGSAGTGYNVMVGPMEIQVNPEDEVQARQLLADVHEAQ
jgi:hypothetical protein